MFKHFVCYLPLVRHPCGPREASSITLSIHSAPCVFPPLGFPFQKALSICLLFKWMRFNCKHNRICWCERVFWTLCLQHTHRTVRGETCSPLYQMRSFMILATYFGCSVRCFLSKVLACGLRRSSFSSGVLQVSTCHVRTWVIYFTESADHGVGVCVSGQSSSITTVRLPELIRLGLILL